MSFRWLLLERFTVKSYGLAHTTQCDYNANLVLEMSIYFFIIFVLFIKAVWKHSILEMMAKYFTQICFLKLHLIKHLRQLSFKVMCSGHLVF